MKKPAAVSDKRVKSEKTDAYLDQATRTRRRRIRGIGNLPPDLGSVFEVDNAKKLSVKETVDYFVSTAAFERLISRKNHIIIGSRGSGKTTWVRMLAHDHVVLASQSRPVPNYARKALAEHLIGIYVPTNVGFVGSLKNKSWHSENEIETYFQWRLNIHSCASLLPVLRSVIDHYVSDRIRRAEAEREICTYLSDVWSDGANIASTITGLSAILVRLESKRVNDIAKLRANVASTTRLHDCFDSELFMPLREAVSIVKRVVGLPAQAKWMICLDEAEYLSPAHHRILNTHLRVSSDDFIFKIATMPFAHHTLETNVGELVSTGHDFEYISVDQEPVASAGDRRELAYLKFARQMFDRRLVAFKQETKMSLYEMLGVSPLIDIKSMGNPEVESAFFELLRRYASIQVQVRAKKLKGTARLRNEIVRKIHGALLLVDAVKARSGNSGLRIYCGESLVVRCSDGNPRRLIRLLNALLLQLRESGAQIQVPLLAPSFQNQVLKSFASDLLLRIQSEGPETVRYVRAIGDWLHHRFLQAPLTTDQISSVRVLEEDGSEVQKILKQAVQLTLLIPHDSSSLMGANGVCEGEFYLAYALAPKFEVMPRKDKSVRIHTVLSADQQKKLEF